MAYRMNISLETGDHTVKTHKTIHTDSGLEFWKNKLRADAPRGSVLTINVSGSSSTR